MGGKSGGRFLGDAFRGTAEAGIGGRMLGVEER